MQRDLRIVHYVYRHPRKRLSTENEIPSLPFPGARHYYYLAVLLALASTLAYHICYRSKHGTTTREERRRLALLIIDGAMIRSPREWRIRYRTVG